MALPNGEAFHQGIARPRFLAVDRQSLQNNMSWAQVGGEAGSAHGAEEL
jgi:hypothetical protein